MPSSPKVSKRNNPRTRIANTHSGGLCRIEYQGTGEGNRIVYTAMGTDSGYVMGEI